MNRLNRRTILILLVLVVVFSVALFYFTYLHKKRPGPITEPTPTPTPLPKMEDLLASPSAYATDEAVLKIEKELKSLEHSLDTVDLEELPLRPPMIDLKVEY